MTVAELMTVWRDRQAEYASSAAMVSGAAMLSRMLQELEAALTGERSEELTISEASHVSGFSTEHLARLVRQGRIANVGRKGAPRVRRGDLPSKAVPTMAGPSRNSYDPHTDARFLSSRR